MLAPHLEFGRDAEEAALSFFLSQTDARLLERNFRCRGGEVDLIFEDGPDLVFVEVRARAAKGLLRGYESIDWKKKERLERVMRLYLSRYHGRARSLRLDVLSWDNGAWTHLKNAWF